MQGLGGCIWNDCVILFWNLGLTCGVFRHPRQSSQFSTESGCGRWNSSSNGFRSRLRTDNPFHSTQELWIPAYVGGNQLEKQATKQGSQTGGFWTVSVRVRVPRFSERILDSIPSQTTPFGKTWKAVLKTVPKAQTFRERLDQRSQAQDQHCTPGESDSHGPWWTV